MIDYDENTTVIGLAGNKWRVFVTSNAIDSKEPYFCVSHNELPNIDRALVSFKEPKIIEGRLSNEEINAVIDLLQSKNEKELYKHLETMWQYAICIFNEEVVNFDIRWDKITKETIQNEKKYKRGRWKLALPIDLEMPDYSKLLNDL